MRPALCDSRCGEVAAILEIAVEDHLLLPGERLADRLGVNVRVAVHVATDPGAEAQDGGQLDGVRGHAVMLLERLRDLLVEGRHDAIEDLDQIEEHLLALIAHGQPLARQLLGLPGGGELDADAAPQIARILRRQHRVEPVEQVLRDPLLLAQQRAAGRLHGMRGEHRLDAQAAEEGQHLLEARGRGLSESAMPSSTPPAADGRCPGGSTPGGGGCGAPSPRG